MKRGENKWLLLFVFALLVFPSLSAYGFPDLWGKITGKATSGTASVNITIGNSAPTIGFVQAISAQDPTIGSTTSITFNFTVTDTDGASNINTSSGEAYFTRSGEATRSNTSCTQIYSAVGNNLNFTCTIDMWYYDENGAWDINVTAVDINGARAINSSTTFTYNVQTAMTMSPTSLSWNSVGLSDTDTGSSNDPIIINNSGNDVDLNINVTGLNLRGETTTSEYIFANNFTVENASEGCSGTTLANATSTNITSAILQRGNNSLDYNNATSGQEQIYFCLKGVPQDISAQSYSSSAYGAWTVEIIT